VSCQSSHCDISYYVIVSVLLSLCRYVPSVDSLLHCASALRTCLLVKLLFLLYFKFHQQAKRKKKCPNKISAKRIFSTYSENSPMLASKFFFKIKIVAGVQIALLVCSRARLYNDRAGDTLNRNLA